jgi:hypothetical protein
MGRMRESRIDHIRGRVDTQLPSFSRFLHSHPFRFLVAAAVETQQHVREAVDQQPDTTI